MTDQFDVLHSIDDLDLKLDVAAGWAKKDYTPMPSNDPAQVLIATGFCSTPTVYDHNCYICRDPEFAMMGLPLCFACPECNGHIAADDPDCECGYSAYEDWLDSQA